MLVAFQVPLQPQSEQLDGSTYEVFERDPVKYVKYEEAIFQAMQNLLVEKKLNRIHLMILGAGRGPLVQRALNAEAQVPRCPSLSPTRTYVDE